jgi:hypothetical protein
MSKSATAPTRKRPDEPRRVRSFKRGDRVRFAGAGKDWVGTVVETQQPDGTRSIHPRIDDTAVYVKFDDTGVTIAVSVLQLSKLSERRR